MGNREYLILTVIGAIVLLICQNTKFDLAGGICAFVLLGIISFIQLYTYNEKKHQFSNVIYKFKSNEYFWPIINCLILGQSTYKNNFKNITTGSSTTIEGAMDIALFLFVLMQVYIYIIRNSIISTEGILLSDGRYVKFNEISSIVAVDGIMNKYKKITIIFNKTAIQEFRINYFNYENIKNHLKLYGDIEVMEGKK